MYTKYSVLGHHLLCLQLVGADEEVIVDVGHEDGCTLTRFELAKDERIIGIKSRVDLSFCRYEHYNVQFIIGRPWIYFQ